RWPGHDVHRRRPGHSHDRRARVGEIRSLGGKMFDPQIETMPQEKLRELQGERLGRLVRYVSERVPFYRRALADAGVEPGAVRSIDDVRRLPITRKHHLHDNYPMGLCAVKPEELARVHASSGTTGKPTIVGYTK